MRGDQHVLLSLSTAGLLIAPHLLYLDPALIVLILFGVFVGSLAPDADAADAAIFNGRFGRVSGKRWQIANGLAVVLPIFGYTIRYFIYYPLSLVFSLILRKSYRHRHRGLLHSFAGIVLMSLVLSVYLALALAVFGAPLGLAPIFGGAFFAGCVLHLLEDTCTPAGIAWLYPFSRRRMAGCVRTQGWIEVRPAIFAVVLTLAAIGMFIVSFIDAASRESLGCLALIVASILWLLFMLVCRVRCEQRR